MEKLTARLELKMREETMQGLLEIHKKHRLSPAEVCRALAEGAVEYFRKNGRFGFPISLSEETHKPTLPVKINPQSTASAEPAKSHKPTKAELHATQKAVNESYREDADSSAAPGLILGDVRVHGQTKRKNKGKHDQRLKQIAKVRKAAGYTEAK